MTQPVGRVSDPTFSSQLQAGVSPLRVRSSGAWLLTLALAALLVAAARAEDAAPAPAKVYTPPERRVDLEHVALDLEFDLDGRAVAGRAALRFRPLVSGLATLDLHAEDMRIRQVLVLAAAADGEASGSSLQASDFGLQTSGFRWEGEPPGEPAGATDGLPASVARAGRGVRAPTQSPAPTGSADAASVRPEPVEGRAGRGVRAPTQSPAPTGGDARGSTATALSPSEREPPPPLGGRVGVGGTSPRSVPTLALSGDAAPQPAGGMLRIPLPPLARGAAALALIEYEAHPRIGLYFVGPDRAYPDKPAQIYTQGEPEDHHYWFPIHDAPDERITSEVRVTVPAAWTVLSNGARLSVQETPDGGRKVYHWRTLKPHAPYLLSIVAGDFVEYAETYERPDGSTVPLSYYLHRTQADEGTMRRSFADTPALLRVFEDFVGVPYPWEKYAQITVADFPWGGMENVSATTLTDRTLADERAALDRNSFTLVAHELAHQWFGDLVTCDTWKHLWLNEGFATYLAGLAVRELRPREQYEAYRRAQLDRYLDEGRRTPRALVPESFADPMDLFDGHSYQKGCLVLGALADELGEETFRAGLRRYLDASRFETVTTRQLQRAMEAAAGRELGWFFDQWVYRPGHPELAVDWTDDRAAGTVRVRLRQTQTVHDGAPGPVWKMHADLVIGFVDGALETRRVWLEDRETVLLLAAPQAVAGVRLDPRGVLPAGIAQERARAEWEWLIDSFDDREARLAALDALAAHLDDPAIRSRFEGWRDPRPVAPCPDVRTRAAELLVKHHKLTFDAVQARLAVEPSASVRRVLVAGLADAPGADDPSARSGQAAARRAALVAVVESEPSYEVVAAAIPRAATLMPEGALAWLRGLLERYPDQGTVRGACFRALAETKDERAILDLMNGARYGAPEAGRSSALHALGDAFGGEARTRAFLRESLDDRNNWFRASVYDLVGKLGGAEELAVLRQRAEHEPDARWRDRARRAAERIDERLKKPGG